MDLTCICAVRNRNDFRATSPSSDVVRIFASLIAFLEVQASVAVAALRVVACRDVNMSAFAEIAGPPVPSESSRQANHGHRAKSGTA
eukprot:scaffold356598_cov14-Prasinocladus_malaysianus.AAC.1